MQFERDYYAILGVPSDTDEQTIKRAYRQLVRRYHPDVSTEEQATEKFRQVQEAYELLVDPLQRKAYDLWRKQQGVDYPLPLVLRVIPSQKVLRCLGEPQILYVLVELSASEKVDSQRLPLNLCLVLDRSTSMQGARLQQVKEASRYIVDQMGPEDILSLAVFSDRAQLVLPGHRGMDKAAAHAAISSIWSGGGTELFQGLNLGLQEVQRWHSDHVVSHLILLTDGQTYGDEEDCLQAARLAGQQHIRLTTMGVGSDWNDKLLDEMATLSNGTCVYIDSTAKITKAFQDQLHSLGSILIHNLVLSAHLGEEVMLKEVFLISPEIKRLHSTDDRLALGSLEKQQPQAMMLELLIGSHGPGAHRLLQVDVEGKLAVRDCQPVRARQAVTVTFKAEIGRQAPVPPNIVSAMGKLTVFKMQERVMAEVETGRIESAVNRLKTLATRLLNIGEVELARAAMLEASRLTQSGTLSAEGRKKIRYGTRRLTILPKEVQHD